MIRGIFLAKSAALAFWPVRLAFLQRALSPWVCVRNSWGPKDWELMSHASRMEEGLLALHGPGCWCTSRLVTHARGSCGFTRPKLCHEEDREKTARVPVSSDCPGDDPQEIVKPPWPPGTAQPAAETAYYTDVANAECSLAEETNGHWALHTLRLVKTVLRRKATVGRRVGGGVEVRGRAPGIRRRLLS